MDNNEEILQLLNRLLEELHQADGNNKKGSTVINIYGKGSQHIDKVENQYFYGDEWHKQGKNNDVTPPPDLPDTLSTEKAMVLWKKAQKAGFVDEHYQPQLSRTLSAVFANEMARRLEIKNKWSIFEKLWHRKNMRSDYSTAQTQRQSLVFRDKLLKILN